MLQNAYLLAKIGADTAENEQHFAKKLRKTDYYPTGPERPPKFTHEQMRTLVDTWDHYLPDLDLVPR